jgi:hypothetical protein
MQKKEEKLYGLRRMSKEWTVGDDTSQSSLRTASIGNLESPSTKRTKASERRRGDALGTKRVMPRLAALGKSSSHEVLFHTPRDDFEPPERENFKRKEVDEQEDDEDAADEENEDAGGLSTSMSASSAADASNYVSSPLAGDRDGHGQRKKKRKSESRSTNTSPRKYEQNDGEDAHGQAESHSSSSSSSSKSKLTHFLKHAKRSVSKSSSNVAANLSPSSSLSASPSPLGSDSVSSSSSPSPELAEVPERRSRKKRSKLGSSSSSQSGRKHHAASLPSVAAALVDEHVDAESYGVAVGATHSPPTMSSDSGGEDVLPGGDDDQPLAASPPASTSSPKQMRRAMRDTSPAALGMNNSRDFVARLKKAGTATKSKASRMAMAVTPSRQSSKSSVNSLERKSSRSRSPPPSSSVPLPANVAEALAARQRETAAVVESLSATFNRASSELEDNMAELVAAEMGRVAEQQRRVVELVDAQQSLIDNIALTQRTFNTKLSALAEQLARIEARQRRTVTFFDVLMFLWRVIVFILTLNGRLFKSSQ